MDLMARKTPEESGAADFGRRLRELRKSRSWTQQQLAEQVGIERAIIGNYELGLHYPAMPVLAKLALVFQVSADRLLGLHEAEQVEIQDRRLYQLFVEADRADFATQGLIKQVVESLLTTGRPAKLRTGTKG